MISVPGGRAVVCPLCGKMELVRSREMLDIAETPLPAFDLHEPALPKKKIASRDVRPRRVLPVQVSRKEDRTEVGIYAFQAIFLFLITSVAWQAHYSRLTAIFAKGILFWTSPLQVLLVAILTIIVSHNIPNRFLYIPAAFFASVCGFVIAIFWEKFSTVDTLVNIIGVSSFLFLLRSLTVSLKQRGLSRELPDLLACIILIVVVVLLVYSERSIGFFDLYFLFMSLIIYRKNENYFEGLKGTVWGSGAFLAISFAVSIVAWLPVTLFLHFFMFILKFVKRRTQT
jgi:hypothetical protein